MGVSSPLNRTARVENTLILDVALCEASEITTWLVQFVKLHKKG